MSTVIDPHRRPFATAAARMLIALLALIVGAAATSVAHGQTARGDLNRGAVITGTGLPNLVIPPLDPVNGRRLYGEKGCVVCHAINGIGGDAGPSFDASRQPLQMNPFDFAAKMWNRSENMLLEQFSFGSQVQLTGAELADLFAFINSVREQLLFSRSDVPSDIRRLYE